MGSPVPGEPDGSGQTVLASLVSHRYNFFGIGPPQGLEGELSQKEEGYILQLRRVIVSRVLGNPQTHAFQSIERGVNQNLS